MNEPYREVAGAIIRGTCGRFLYQQRDDIATILYPGQIGLFGGHREAGESFLDCARRELEEEIGLVLAPERLTPLVAIRASYGRGSGVKGEFFVVSGIVLDGIRSTEGTAIIVDAADMPALLHRMTPTASYASRLYLELHTAAGR